jgi:polyribonucleotide nucleotidyltransferase
MSEVITVSLGEHELSIEVGKLAKQADGAVLMRYGDTAVLVSACSETKPKEGLNFFPLTCDYRENTYAAGKIPGGFFKREGRPTEKEILTSRMIDRPVRPLFPDHFRCETQIIASVLSADPEINPDIIAINGASADKTEAIIWVSHRKWSGKRGRTGRSIMRLVKISFSVGRPSRLKKPPGIFPAA